MKKYFKCSECNDLHYGLAAPEICPTCRDKDDYVEVDIHEARNILGIE